MKREDATAKLNNIILFICKREITDYTKNVFSYEMGISSRDLAYIFLEIEKEFGIDLNQLISIYKHPTIEQLVEGICKLEHIHE